MMKRIARLVVVLALALALSACGSTDAKITVLYAGSLVTFIEDQVGPSFEKAHHVSVEGIGAGSTALAGQIKGKVHRGDVFISASTQANESLEGAANGNWESWYISFATSGLVLGYNPKSAFAHDLHTKPWYEVIRARGFRLGSTDPATDPKGALAVRALETRRLPESTSTYFPEETLIGRLQAGQLDAGFFYASEAKAAGIATVPLAGVDLKATYSVTILRDAPHESNAAAFVRYLLGPEGRAALQQDGFTLIEPVKVVGTGVPSGLTAR